MDYTTTAVQRVLLIQQGGAWNEFNIVQHQKVKDINRDLNTTSNLLIIIKGEIHMPGKNCLERRRNRNVYTALEQIIYLPTAS